jgi:uncharacterized protein YdiU (UPF0061 family)
VAPSFIRFGNFEILAARDERALLNQLVDFTIARDFPHLEGDVATKRGAWFREVCERSARMVVDWMRVGFVHGVMNTDNMSILGLTIDYGPYGWLEDFDPNWTPNTTDAVGRRYRYGQQPAIVQWNLVRLAEALRPVFDTPEPLEAGLDAFLAVYDGAYERMMSAKFGFAARAASGDNVALDDAEQQLIREAFGLMHAAQADYTLFFRALGNVPGVIPHDATIVSVLGDVFYHDDVLVTHNEPFMQWLRRWHAHVFSTGESASTRRARMHAVNPKYVLRNWIAQEAIDLADQGDSSRINALLQLLRAPYDEQPGNERFAAKRPEWARHKAGCSMLSCSS